MSIITLSMPDELKREMEQSREINWSEVAREAIKSKIIQLRILKTIASKSHMTEKDAEEISNKINESLRKRFK